MSSFPCIAALNPVYERGADSIMMSGELNTAYAKDHSHTYQPIVQNTKENGDSATYASLQRDSNKQPFVQESVYQALHQNTPRKSQPEDQYQSLSRHRRECQQQGTLPPTLSQCNADSIPGWLLPSLATLLKSDH